jgi:DNA-binding transcriptional LysR family regulator
MHMTQPNATRMLAELEEMLGARLYERSPRGLIATPYGLAVIEQAHVLLSNVDQIDSTMQSLLNGDAGLVRVGMMASIAPTIVVQALTGTEGLLSRAQVRITEGAHDMLAERLRHGDLDLVVGRVRPDTALDGLKVQLLVQEEFTTVAGNDHPLARRQHLCLAEVLDQPWVLPPPAVVVRQGFDALFLRECGRAPVQVTESVSVFTNLYLLRSSPLLGIMPATVASDLQDNGLLRRLPLPLVGIVGPVVLLLREGGILNRAAERLVQALIAAAGATALVEPSSRKNASGHQKA